MASSNIFREMWLLAQKIEFLSKVNIYDYDMLFSELGHQFDQLNYFYTNLVQKQPDKDPHKTFYNLNKDPKVHQLAYVHLGRGYPKELYDPHWCYIHKICGTKLFAIPTTSHKPTTSTEEREYYYDIEQADGIECRLRLDEMRIIDRMRIVEDKGYVDIKTDRIDILKRLGKFLDIPMKEEEDKKSENDVDKS